MVAAQADHSRVLPGTVVRCGVVQHLSVPLLHLFECVGGVEWCDGDVSAVNLHRLALTVGKRVRAILSHDFQALFVRIDSPHGVVASSLLFPCGSCADTSRPESGAWSVGC